VERATWRLCMVQAMSLSVAVACCLQENGWIRYGMGSLLFAFSLFYSLQLLSRKSDFFRRLSSRLHLSRD
ncbi:MAG: hypothetical protein SOZ86_05765, partial [Bacteroidaceae bacterium]|nr:hypothetical protein [Bacteroidaceae bacterium]